jgi:formate hydrogenlyase subunit 3/multisubunit Na+/H+ antiporter MnhD subunit
VVAILSIVTMTLGNLMALLQNDVKRLLAYSSIGNVGYMLVGVAVGTQLGLTGTLMHIFNHALIKSTAFLCLGAIIFRIKSRNLQDMAGIGRKMPVTAAFFAISLFALIGMPPFNGFISELTLFTSSVQANVPWLGIAIVLNSLLSGGYCLRILRSLVQPSVSDSLSKVKEAPLLMLMPIGIMVALIIFFGIYPDPLIRFAQQAASGLLATAGR